MMLVWFGQVRWRLYGLAYWPIVVCAVVTPLLAVFALWGSLRTLLRRAAGWEIVAPNVKALSLSYFQNPTTPIAAPVAVGSLKNVRLVQLDITLERTVPGTGQIIDRSARQLFFLQNRERDAP